jgi:hypothetical protein
MTNVNLTPEKVSLRDKLFQFGIDTLKEKGWSVERIPGIGKSSVRRIIKAGKSKTVSIRTSQDKWIAFPRDQKDRGWATLSDVDLVLAVSVDDRHNPKFAQAHLIEAEEMRERFDRAYAARKAANYQMPLGRGVWVSLYHSDADNPVTHVGAGVGLKHPPIARMPLTQNSNLPALSDRRNADTDNQPLTIAEAKRRLAMTLGVDPSSIKITVEA